MAGNAVRTFAARRNGIGYLDTQAACLWTPGAVQY
jgi:hypothetical protein